MSKYIKGAFGKECHSHFPEEETEPFRGDVKFFHDAQTSNVYLGLIPTLSIPDPQTQPFLLDHVPLNSILGVHPKWRRSTTRWSQAGRWQGQDTIGQPWEQGQTSSRTPLLYWDPQSFWGFDLGVAFGMSLWDAGIDLYVVSHHLHLRSHLGD